MSWTQSRGAVFVSVLRLLTSRPSLSSPTQKSPGALGLNALTPRTG
jgi:hypothetical protein